MKSARERQVRRALAAERSRQKRTTDAEIRAYRRYLRVGIPLAMGLNVAMCAFLISQGVYAVAANLVVLPILWLAYVLLGIAQHRDDRKRAVLVSYDEADEDELAAGDPFGPVRPTGPWDCSKQGHLFTVGETECRECGEPYDTVGILPTPFDSDDELAEWVRALDVERAAGDLTDEEYAAERARYEQMIGPPVQARWPHPGDASPEQRTLGCVCHRYVRTNVGSFTCPVHGEVHP